MSELDPNMMDEPGVVEGGGAAATEPEATADPVGRAVAHLQLLSPGARDAVLSKMDPDIAERIRLRLDSMPDSDVVDQRKLLREMSERIHATNTMRQERVAEQQTVEAARPHSTFAPTAAAPAVAASPVANGAAPTNPQVTTATGQPPLDALRVLHPAAIARAMQGERAEAWAIVLDHLDVNARGALQMYLEPAARAAIEDARVRQADLAASAPQLVLTIEAAIARTVVPRAMREHQHLLSTTPPTWDAAAAGMEASWQHA